MSMKSSTFANLILKEKFFFKNRLCRTIIVSCKEQMEDPQKIIIFNRNFDFRSNLIISFSSQIVRNFQE